MHGSKDSSVPSGSLDISSSFFTVAVCEICLDASYSLQLDICIYIHNDDVEFTLLKLQFQHTIIYCTYNNYTWGLSIAFNVKNWLSGHMVVKY